MTAGEPTLTDSTLAGAGAIRERARIGVVKPDFGAVGGFERHLTGLLAGLRRRGWDISVVSLDGRSRPARLYGVPVEPVNLEFHDEYILHLGLIEQVQQLRLDRFDLVLTTQPPTYLAPHDHKVALFYHQARQFYDLADPFVTSGFVDRDVHRAAARAVRALEREAVGEVRRWLAGSEEVAARLERYWSIPPERITVHRAPPTSVPDRPVGPPPATGPVLCVGRQEWPKRTELLVQALHLTRSGRGGHLVGGGSRLDYVRSLDARLHDDPAAAAEPFDDAVWLNRGIFTADWRPFDGPPSGRVVFEGDVNDARRDELYEDALVVVAPAFREDYGLTVLEAMARSRPVIVCEDGGGLTELVEDGINGFVVKPDAASLAAAIDRLVDDPDLAARMGAAGRDVVSAITMDRAVDQVDETFRTVLAGDQSDR